MQTGRWILTILGDVWVMNNWQDIDSCFGDPNEGSRPAAVVKAW